MGALLPSRLSYASAIMVFAYDQGLHYLSSIMHQLIPSIFEPEVSLMAMPCFLFNCRKGRSEHCFVYDQWDNHRGGALFILPTVVLDDIGAMGLFQVV